MKNGLSQSDSRDYAAEKKLSAMDWSRFTDVETWPLAELNVNPKKNRSNVKTSDFLVKYSHDFCETFDNSWSIVLYQQ